MLIETVRVVRRERCEIIHAHNYEGCLIGVAAKLLTGRPMIYNAVNLMSDELHTYRGVFGSHLCNVLRRLRRIARFYGRELQFICSSATIANPGELASRLLEADVEVLNANGAPAAEKTFVFYNPPIVNRALGIRRSYINESARVAQEFG